MGTTPQLTSFAWLDLAPPLFLLFLSLLLLSSISSFQNSFSSRCLPAYLALCLFAGRMREAFRPNHLVSYSAVTKLGHLILPPPTLHSYSTSISQPRQLPSRVGLLGDC